MISKYYLSKLKKFCEKVRMLRKLWRTSRISGRFQKAQANLKFYPWTESDYAITNLESESGIQFLQRIGTDPEYDGIQCLSIRDLEHNMRIACSKFRVIWTSGIRKEVYVMRKFDLADVQTMMSDCQMANLFFALRSRYATIRVIRSRVTQSWLYLRLSSSVSHS